MNKRKPTKKQEMFVDGVMSGMSASAAARSAGYSDKTASQVGCTNKTVQSVLSEARAELARATNIRKKDVVQGVLEAIERARMLGEPNTEIAGWKELAKMLGYYAPEVKKIQLSLDQGRMKSKFEQLSDEELLEIASGNTFEGDYSHVQ